MSPAPFQKELVIRSLKLLDLGYIGAGHFLVGFGIARLFDNVFGSLNVEEEEKKSTARVVCEVVLLLWLNAIILYIFKNLLELVPSPFDGVGGFEHARVNELKSAPLLAFSLLYYQTNLQDKLKLLYNRFATNSSTVQP
jgi:hypothetical protein